MIIHYLKKLVLYQLFYCLSFVGSVHCFLRKNLYDEAHKENLNKLAVTLHGKNQESEKSQEV